MTTESVEVNIADGRLTGRRSPAGVSFLGVPFAAPPVGERRFGPPARPAPWSGTRAADAYGPTAPQPPRGLTTIPEPVVPGEDYLNLNVFAPAEGDRHPVLVWIHGGGFTGGCNRSPWYDGRSFVRDGVVVVAVNYRLGVHGFLPLGDAPGNRAVLDWLAALTWVRDNVAAFGGDPGNVTVAGQSAGGAACATLLATPAAAGLFRRAILMSGSIQFSGSAAHGEALATSVARRLGVAPTREGLAGFSDDELVAAAQAADALPAPTAEAFVARLASGVLSFRPFEDPATVPVAPAAALTSGTATDVEVLMGNTAQEFNAPVRGFLRGLGDGAVPGLLDVLGVAADRQAAYRDAHPGLSPRSLVSQAVTDRLFREPAVRLAEARGAAGAPTWLYDFRWAAPVAHHPGAYHCVDLPFAWDVLDADGVTSALGDAPPAGLAAAMHSAWVSFIRGDGPGWSEYTPDKRMTMVFDEDSGEEPDALAAPRQAWSD